VASSEKILREANEAERVALGAFGRVQDILAADEAASQPAPPVRPPVQVPGSSS
jgi:hypothetical protein